jgi:hypothetical protein
MGRCERGKGDEAVPLQIGDRAGEVAFVQPDGSVGTLAAFAGRPLLLIFLRHLT